MCRFVVKIKNRIFRLEDAILKAGPDPLVELTGFEPVISTLPV